jgi:NADH-quinone oxidoreductase subunit B
MEKGSAGMGLENQLVGDNVLVTSLTKLVNWGRSNSVWPCTFGLACCALEMIASTLADFDISRFGSEVFRPSPRQSDLIIIAGTLSKKMSVMVKRIYDQMADPKWVIAMGACASCGGIFQSYAVVQGVDQIIPVDVYIPGCPPRPEAVLAGLMKIQEKIRTESLDQRPDFKSGLL